MRKISPLGFDALEFPFGLGQADFSVGGANRLLSLISNKSYTLLMRRAPVGPGAWYHATRVQRRPLPEAWPLVPWANGEARERFAATGFYEDLP